MVHTVRRSMSYPRRTVDGTAPDVIVLGYEGIIGGQERPIALRGHIRGGVFAVKGASDGL